MSTVGRSADGRWLPRHSGNPGGRPQGSRSRISTRVLAKLDVEADEILDQLVQHAKDGDRNAAIFLLQLAIPKSRHSAPDPAELPQDLDLSTPEGIAAAHGAIVAAAASGRLDPDQAASLSQLLNSQKQIVDLLYISRRLERLEQGKGQVISLDGFEELPPPDAQGILTYDGS